MASKFVSAVAALALGATASPHPGSSPMKRSAALCSRIHPQGGEICGKPGYVKDDSHRWPLPVMKCSLEACAESCSATTGCGYFVWRDPGLCQGFADGISQAGSFDDRTSASMWYEIGCFACEEAVLDVEFEDLDVSGWTLVTSTDGSHFLDIQNTYTTGGQTSQALRVGEATTDGFARVEWNQELEIKAGSTSMIHFTAKSSAATTNWDLLTLTVYSNPDNLYMKHPQNGTDLGDGWFFFNDEFMAASDWRGHALF
ncbi:Fc.00g023840.m01.CDS01 [Cosmosporella sp. VM-42]